MIHLGDITKIHGCTPPIVDCIIGGSPCQDLSIAGKRAGFDGERSVLFLDQIRVTKEMRHRDRASGRTGELIRPRYMVWENVPGAFSSNGGRDFQSVLTETVRVIEPEAPCVPMPKNGWPTSGCLMGNGWSIAWRVLDAKFWGVPQRRRRIVLIADFGGATAPEILFVRKSLPGDFEPGRAERKAAPGTTETSSESAGAANGIGRPVKCYSLDSLAGNSMKSKNPHSGCREVETTKTLDTSDGNPSKNQGGICIVGTAGLSAGFSASIGAKAGGIGYAVEECPVLSASRHDASVLCLNDQGGAIMGVSENIAGTIRAQEHGHTPVIQEARVFSKTSRPQNAQDGCRWEERSIANTMTRHDTGESRSSELVVQRIVFRENSFGDFREDTCGSTCKQRDCNGTTDIVTENKTVRRLTPMECERLQGFPDGWTDIGPWTDSKGKLHKESSDSARYKALGNSIALPPWKWVLKRLCAQYERDATMATLFDGIGGFPLIWEQLNGKGSCLWASEIEEFPIAVTKYHFGGERL